MREVKREVGIGTCTQIERVVSSVAGSLAPVLEVLDIGSFGRGPPVAARRIERRTAVWPGQPSGWIEEADGSRLHTRCCRIQR
jgi:hypothetical protein